ncbi:hypothetical protein EJ04DRAFT_518143 [Polyplosphaeria fusca]|uniref:Phosphatidate phosphatase APP1 catalytic domain-containing protein n=1 Tax=Polyplosphaeria fusca TaxID=682080 RepID=A0A9P4RC93_9PLEO|nr:hypothetical protein EJ04DRAFT_518143 [Polyplosphaeria fusca]
MAEVLRILKGKWISPPKAVEESYEGRTIIVTGANVGIGFEAVAKFRQLGASKIILAVRSVEKGEAAKTAIEARQQGQGQLEVWELDMGSYDSIVAFAKRAASLDRLDIALLNAGVHKAAFAKSKLGWEEDLQVNTVSTTLLGILLLPKLKASKQANGKTPILEIVNSGLHVRCQLDPKIVQGDNILEAYNAPENVPALHDQYSRSKLFLMYATNKLAELVSPEDVIITSVCPGMVQSELGRDYKFPGVGVAIWVAGALVMRTGEQGARVYISATTAGKESHGRFYQNDQIRPLSPSVAGEANKKTAEKVWGELVRILSKDVPGFADSLGQITKVAQAQKLKSGPGILQRLRGRTRKLSGTAYLENEALRRRMLTQSRDSEGPRNLTMSYSETREPGARRKKLTGYLKAANELRQTYQQQYASGWSSRETAYDYEDDTPGGFPDAAVPQAQPGTIQETPGDGRDVRDSAGAGDAEFWKQQWDNYEDDKAVVDVDVRGWIYSPHKGQMSRKQRLFIGLARQLVGIQAPPAGAVPTSSSASPNSSRDPSPGQMGHRGRAQAREAQRDEMLTAREAEEILRKGEQEAEAAAAGKYSEKPAPDDGIAPPYRTHSSDSLTPHHRISRTPSNTSLQGDEHITPLQKRASWAQPANMSPAELAEANARLMARLRHFLAIPMANTPISVFFYNEDVSKQRTVYTNPSGHFSICAALDFVPTHVRILASDKLSATEEIIITAANGVSVISDIDDTIKHSAISSGAREIFRNAFIRELGDLTIDGVKEWYNSMAALGVKFHYVSNSPWQLFPVIQKYFSMAGLPPGSFHLKQYSGMLQGIFEPVAERKKATLDKIARDFPDRSFILIGDSGEADLEVYTDFVLENPGRVIAVFIRDVTTPEGGGFFDPSVGAMGSDNTSQRGSESSSSRFASSSSGVEDDDPHVKAAIAASLRDMEAEERRRSKSLFPTMPEDHPELRPRLPPRKTQPAAATTAGDLIDLSEDPPESLPSLRRVESDTKAETDRASISSASSTKPAPPPPRKPVALRSSSGDSSSPSTPAKASPPPALPKPRGLSSTAQQASPLSKQVSPTTSKPPPPPGPKPPIQTQQSYAGMARDKLSSVYNNLPTMHAQPGPDAHTSQTVSTTNSAEAGQKKTAPPPPPPRRGITAYPVAAASYVGTKAASAWQNAPALPHPSTRPNLQAANANSFSTSSSQPYPQRTNTGSTFGANGNGNGVNQNGYGEQAGLDKRVVLWMQRWQRAEHVLKQHRVVLRSWRVGTDVVKEAEKLVKEAADRERRRGGR